MPEADFFRRLGLFIVSDFLDAELCNLIRTEIQSSHTFSSAVVTTAGVDRVDEVIRKTKLVQLSKATEYLVEQRLIAVKPKIEAHFRCTLGDCEHPNFLVYNEGDFFAIHVDSSIAETADIIVKQRRISIVTFINEQSDIPGLNDYVGGSLVLYGLIKQTPWEKYGFNIQGQSGLLVAFPADTVHEVTPVTQGIRFTIVTWFSAKE